MALYERETFPRAHVGESLLPATLAILDDIGVLPAIEAEGFVRKAGATMSWGRNDAPWSWYFAETNRRYPHSYQVWRPRFDQILLEHSARCGVHVHQGIAVKSVHEDGVRLADGKHVDAALVVDATGQNALVANARGMKEWDPFFRNLAVYGYYAGGAHLDPPDDGNIFIEAYAHGWLWKIPLTGGVSSVGAVVDRDFGAAAIREAGLEGFFRDQVAMASRSAALLREAELREGPFAVRDWSYRASAMTGPGFVLVGDAACFIDPLFSTGVHLAVTGAHISRRPTSRPHCAHRRSRSSAADVLRTAIPHAVPALPRTRRCSSTASNRAQGLLLLGSASAHRRDTSEIRASAFVRAVSGQAAAGYERSVLRHGVLPEDFSTALEQELAERDARRMRPDAGTRVRMAAGLEVRAAAVLGDGCFEPGYVIAGPHRDDLPVSPLVASLGHHARGDTLDTIAARIAIANDADTERVREAVVAAAELLIADGVLEALSGP